MKFEKELECPDCELELGFEYLIKTKVDIRKDKFFEDIPITYYEDKDFYIMKCNGKDYISYDTSITHMSNLHSFIDMNNEYVYIVYKPKFKIGNQDPHYYDYYFKFLSETPFNNLKDYFIALKNINFNVDDCFLYNYIRFKNDEGELLLNDEKGIKIISDFIEVFPDIKVNWSQYFCIEIDEIKNSSFEFLISNNILTFEKKCLVSHLDYNKFEIFKKYNPNYDFKLETAYPFKDKNVKNYYFVNSLIEDTDMTLDDFLSTNFDPEWYDGFHLKIDKETLANLLRKNGKYEAQRLSYLILNHFFINSDDELFEDIMKRLFKENPKYNCLVCGKAGKSYDAPYDIYTGYFEDIEDYDYDAIKKYYGAKYKPINKFLLQKKNKKILDRLIHKVSEIDDNIYDMYPGNSVWLIYSKDDGYQVIEEK
jgi:hypothetical protein